MQVSDKILYHFHKLHRPSDMWIPNNEFVIDNNFKNYYLNVLDSFDTTVETVKKNRVPFDFIIKDYLEEEQDVETYIKMLKDARRIIYSANIFKRELALETVRQEKFPNLPSRKHVLWMCDDKQLDFWEKALVDGSTEYKLELYKVLVNGNIFKSSHNFLPSFSDPYETNLKDAENYWNPVFKTEDDEETAEYLFQGKVKVLKKIK